MNIKKPIGIIVDSGADIPEEIIKKYEIEVVPLKVDWSGIDNLSGQNVYQKMRTAEQEGIVKFGKTSQPSPKDFLNAFRKQMLNFDSLICVTITSKLSGTYNSAIQAKNFLLEGKDKIFIVDSLSGSGAEGLLVLKIIDLIKEGKKAEEIVNKIKSPSISKVYLRVMLEDVKWIEASGRLPHIAANLLRSIQKIGIRPMIGVKRGLIVPIGLKTRVKDISGALFSEFEVWARRESNKKNRVIRLAITHGDNLTEARRLRKIIEDNFQQVEFAFINLMDDVLGAVAGPGVVALAWTPID